MNAAKLIKRSQKQRWQQKAYKMRKLKLREKSDPLGKSAQAKGIVIEKFQKEAAQPKTKKTVLTSIRHTSDILACDHS